MERVLFKSELLNKSFEFVYRGLYASIVLKNEGIEAVLLTGSHLPVCIVLGAMVVANRCFLHVKRHREIKTEKYMQ